MGQVSEISELNQFSYYYCGIFARLCCLLQVACIHLVSAKARLLQTSIIILQISLNNMLLNIQLYNTWPLAPGVY